MMAIEIKEFGGKLIEFKQHDRNGVPVGIIKGYGATWDLDRGDYYYRDQFVKGAFLESIQEHKDNNSRQIRFKDSHGRTIGGIPIETVMEDDTGLYIEGELNLELEQARDLYSLIKQGVIVEFSIGFSSSEYTIDEDEKIRSITKATIWEISPVSEPMNPEAVITEVKATNHKALEIKEIDFDYAEALLRVESHKDKEKAYIGKYLIADVVDGEIKAIPDAIYEASGLIRKLPEADKKSLVVAINKYYAKMKIDSPFSSIIDVDKARELKPRELERTLKESGRFSGKAAKVIASQINKEATIELEAKEDYTDLLTDIKNMTKTAKV